MLRKVSKVAEEGKVKARSTPYLVRPWHRRMLEDAASKVSAQLHVIDGKWGGTTRWIYPGWEHQCAMGGWKDRRHASCVFRTPTSWLAM